MKKLTFILLTCFFTSAFGQEITFTELKNGISNPDAFIAELIQQGFYIDSHEVDDSLSLINALLFYDDYDEWSTFRINIWYTSDTIDGSIGSIDLMFCALINGSKADRYENLYRSITEEIKLNCGEPLGISYSERDNTYISRYELDNINFSFFVEREDTGSDKTNGNAYYIGLIFKFYLQPSTNKHIEN